MNILSLFANIGVAEARLNETEHHVVVANELIPKRAQLYQQLYPESIMITGDIMDNDIYHQIVQSSIDAGVEIVMATPPCQGMSTAGQQLEDDVRNNLVLPAIHIIQDLNPRYALIENVPEFLNTKILYNSEKTLLTDVINQELGNNYHIEINVINTDDYGVPQTRSRMIILMTRNDIADIWHLPDQVEHKVTMQDAIGHLPSIDPFVKDLDANAFHQLFPMYEERKNAAIAISRWHIPPVHVYRQVHAMMYTPTGQTAFDNVVNHRPIKKDGTPVRGYHNTYKRQNWNTPAYTVTMDNRKISSQNNVHPGRLIGPDENGENVYSDARTLTLYELMIVMSIPVTWPIPENTDEAFIRRIIGEGIPPLFIQRLFENLH